MPICSGVEWSRIIRAVGVLLWAALLHAMVLSVRAETFVVTNAANAGPGTLREAITRANTNVNASAESNLICFAISNAGPHTIELTSSLPTITNAMFIDGYTQPDATPNTLVTGSDALLRIELDGSGAGPVANGLTVSAGGCTIRGLVINGFGGSGILLHTKDSNRIAGNFIGTTVNGVSARGNNNGISILGSWYNLIGGQTPAEVNVISGNGQLGIEVQSDGNRIEGNLIGVSAAGTVGLANGTDGLIMYGSDNTIGGSAPGAGNVISANAQYGIELVDASSNVVAGNRIGTDRTGAASLGNGYTGMFLLEGAAYNRIGGTNAGEGNIIANNIEGGIALDGAAGVGNAILGNNIYNYGGFGIDLGDDGTTFNDTNDPDSGPNELQNYPVLIGATNGAGTWIGSSLDSTPNRAYRIEFFGSTSTNVSGYVEGQRYLGSANVTTDGTGLVSFTTFLSSTVASNEVITATATDPNGNTSEFSDPVGVTAGAIPGAEPLIYVNGQTNSSNSFRLDARPVIEIVNPYGAGFVLYSLNGSDPRQGRVYTGPFLLESSAVVRAIAYPSDLSGETLAIPVSVVIEVPPAILVPPADRVAVPGDSVSFGVVATGTAPLQYQWRRNDVDVMGAMGPALVFPTVALGDAGMYRVVVSNLFGAVTSAPVTLEIQVPPTIAMGPASTNVAPGGSVTFSVSVNGSDPLAYQWRKNGVNIAGATNNTLTIAPVQIADGASYSVVVANPAGAAISDPAQLSITILSPAPGDDFADATSISGETGQASGTNVMATGEAGEPLHVGKPGTNSVWYAWTAPDSGIATFRTTGSTFDTLLGIYTGTSVGALEEAASDEDRGGHLTSEARFNAASGITYAIAIAGFGGGQGHFVLEWNLEPTTNTLPVVQCPPASLTVQQGQDAMFSVTATGGALGYQWLFNGGVIPGATASTYTRPNIQPEDVGVYSALVVGASMRSVESLPAILEIGPDPQVQSKDKPDDVVVACPSGGGKGSQTAAATSPPFASVAMGTIGYQLFIQSTNNIGNCFGTNCGGVPVGARYLQLNPQVTGNFVLDTVGSAVSTKIWVCRKGSNNLDRTLTFIVCDQGGAPNGQSRVQFLAEAGRSYEAWVGRLDSTSQRLQLNWAFGLPPVLASIPPPQLVPAGSALTLHALATNRVEAGVTNVMAAPVCFWYFQETNFIAASSQLILESIQLSNAGTYTVIASNVIGSTLSVVRVGVYQNTPVRLGRVGDQVQWFIVDGGGFYHAAGTRYQWYRSGQVLVGQTNFSLVLPEVMGGQEGTYRVTFNNVFGNFSLDAGTLFLPAHLGLSFDPNPTNRNAMFLKWPTTPMKRYSVQYRDSLRDDAEWSSLDREIQIFENSALVEDPVSSGPRFYRLLEWPIQE